MKRQDGPYSFLLEARTPIAEAQLLRSSEFERQYDEALAHLYFVRHHVGETADDAQTFDEHYGSSEWKESLLGRWDGFLHEVYRESL